LWESYEGVDVFMGTKELAKTVGVYYLSVCLLLVVMSGGFGF